MKANKGQATGPSTDGSTTTPARQEALAEKAQIKKQGSENGSDAPDSNDINDDEEMHSDDSDCFQRLDSEICLPRGKFTYNHTHS